MKIILMTSKTSLILMDANTKLIGCFAIQKETSMKMYTPFKNRIKFVIWTICTFRVLNPRQ